MKQMLYFLCRTFNFTEATQAGKTHANESLLDILDAVDIMTKASRFTTTVKKFYYVRVTSD